MAFEGWQEDYISQIASADDQAYNRSIDKWNSISKPIGGLGRLEDVISQIASITGSENVDISRRALIVSCSDNGVLVQGVSQSDYDVTSAMSEAIAHGEASVNQMASIANVDVYVYNLGVKDEVDGPIDVLISNATADMSVGPAMTIEQTKQAIDRGVQIVRDLKAKGYSLMATGEMGVGNTSTSAALASVLLGLPPEVTTGKGSGLGGAALERKIEVVKKSIAVNGPDYSDPLVALSKLGGYDIACMVGIFLGGAIERIPIVADGLISCVSALIAKRAFPGCEMAILGSHVSSEPAAIRLIEELGIITLIDAGMRLGEGTGAVAAISLIDMANAVYSMSKTFDAVGIDAYEVNPE